MTKGALTTHANTLRRRGRYGDKHLVHVNDRELGAMSRAWGPPTRNPDTGLPEHFGFKDLLKFAAPAAAIFAPSLGGSIGSLFSDSPVFANIIGSGLLGAGAGAIGGRKGDRLSSALTGGLLGAGTAAIAPILNNALAGTTFGRETLGLTPQESLMGPGTLGSRERATAEQFNRNMDNPSLFEGNDAPSPIPMNRDGTFGSAPSRGAAALGRVASTGGSKGGGALDGYGLPIALGGAALLAGAMGDEPVEQSGVPSKPTGELYATLDPMFIRRENKVRAGITPQDWFTYGQPGSSIPNQFIATTFETPAQRKQREDEAVSLGAASGGYFGGGAPGNGRADTIPARLSNNEYVMDAESVALLGDGSPDAGARQLDQLRAKLRQHKGKALSRGKISPNAKPPEQYMRGAR